jgi:hypothetical protein
MRMLSGSGFDEKAERMAAEEAFQEYGLPLGSLDEESRMFLILEAAAELLSPDPLPEPVLRCRYCGYRENYESQPANGCA